MVCQGHRVSFVGQTLLLENDNVHSDGTVGMLVENDVTTIYYAPRYHNRTMKSVERISKERLEHKVPHNSKTISNCTYVRLREFLSFFSTRECIVFSEQN